MLHMFLICYDPAVPLGPNDPPTLQPQHAALEKELREEGVYVSGAALMPPEMAPVVRAKDGKRMTDGPYTETKELVGGYYIIDCKDAADAERQAHRIPVASNTWIQIRPLFLYRDAMHTE